MTVATEIYSPAMHCASPCDLMLDNETKSVDPGAETYLQHNRIYKMDLVILLRQHLLQSCSMCIALHGEVSNIYIKMIFFLCKYACWQQPQRYTVLCIMVQ